MEQTSKLEEVFHKAVELPAKQRRTFLKRVCARNVQLRCELQSLLDADDSAGNFLESRPVENWCADLIRLDAEEVDNTGSPMIRSATIGRYQLVRAIASGGMGTIYEAIQESPRRRVALKVLRTSLPTESAIRRFEFEAEILGRLRHPSIAQIFEAGTHVEHGNATPYFAMEFIEEGETLIDFASRYALSRRKRLLLFAQVCDAVAYAHQQGIVHRDLKPSNILVTPDGTPKVIDFGVATGPMRPALQATDGEPETEPTFPELTSVGSIFGTPAYMSPEQLLHGSGSADDRSDVYAMGVILCELLTGTRMQDTAFNRRRSGLDEDLRLIILRATAANPQDRYGTVAEMSCDIRRFLEVRPILARPRTPWYSLSRFVARNPATSALGGAIVVVLLVSGVLFALDARRIAVQRDAAELSAQRANRVRRFLVATLGAIDPSNGGLNITGGELLSQAAARIDREMSDDPEVRADVQSEIGSIYSRLGEFDRANPLLKAALATYEQLHGEDSRQAANALYNLGCMYCEKGEVATALPMWTRAYNIKQRLYGENDPRTAYMLQLVGVACQFENDWTGAEEKFRRAISIMRGAQPDGSVELACTLASLASVCARDGRADDADSLYKEALSMKQRYLGLEHPEVATTLLQQGRFLNMQDRLEEASDCLSRALAIRRKQLGMHHMRTRECLSELAEIVEVQGDFETAADLWETLLASQCEKLSPDDAQIADSMERWEIAVSLAEY